MSTVYQLTTPNKRSGDLSVDTKNSTPNSISLSPFLPSKSRLNLCSSPFVADPLLYYSPEPSDFRKPRLEELLIQICDDHNRASLFDSREALAQKKCCEARIGCPSDLSTPPKPNEGTGSGCVTGEKLSGTKIDIGEECSERGPKKIEFEGSELPNDETFKSKDSSQERIIRKRKRKTSEQLRLLEQEYERNPEWNKGKMSEVAFKTGLSEAQVYKWGWDQKKKKTELC